MNYVKLICISLFAISPAMADPQGPPPIEIVGPVDANVINTVDTNVLNTVDAEVVNTVGTNVLNTVDANLVTTVSSEGLVGLDFGPGIAVSIIAALGDPRRLLSISTGIAPDVPGEFCSFSVRAGVGDQTTITHIGFSGMSNGEAANVSRNYTVPVAPVNFIEWVITSSAGGPCWVSLSFVTEPSETAATASAQALAAPDAIRLEVR
jgi:hypothetical protein